MHTKEREEAVLYTLHGRHSKGNISHLLNTFRLRVHAKTHVGAALVLLIAAKCVAAEAAALLVLSVSLPVIKGINAVLRTANQWFEHFQANEGFRSDTRCVRLWGAPHARGLSSTQQPQTDSARPPPELVRRPARSRLVQTIHSTTSRRRVRRPKAASAAALAVRLSSLPCQCTSPCACFMLQRLLRRG